MDLDNSNSENPQLFPLTQGQVSIWLAQMLNESDPAFNIGECIEICGAVDKECFELALRQAVKEAGALHLRVVRTADGPQQYIGNDDNWVMPFVVFDSRSAAEAWMRADMSRVFDLAHGPLFRFALLRISEDRYFFYAVNHHLVNDGFGWTLLLRRVADIYGRLTNGQYCELERFASQNDLVDAEVAYRRSQNYLRDRDYWLNLLKGCPEATTLSACTAATAPDAGVRQITGWLPGEVDIESFGRAYGSSAAAVMMAGIALYFYRMTGSCDIVLGMQVSARIGRHSKRAVGMAANVIPFRLRLNPNEDFDALLRRTARAMREAFRHQLYRIEDLRRDLGLSSRTADLFSAFANYMPLDDDIRFSDHVIRRLPLGNWRVEDIQFVYYGGSAETGYRIDVVANSARYDLKQLDEHLHNLFSLLSQCTSRPDTISNRAALLSSSEQEKMSRGINNARYNYQGDALVHQYFEKQARVTPDKVAVSFETTSLTYSELNLRANKLARCLRAEGVGPDILVPICLDQSIEMLVALLAVLKSGGAYVPIDPALGPDRIALLLETIHPSIILTANSVRAQIPSVECKDICVDRDGEAISSFAGTDLDAQSIGLTPNNLACVIFSLGLTGRPTETLNEHQGVANRLQWMQDQYHLTIDDCVLQKTPFELSASVWELFWPLGVGAKLIMAKPSGYLEPEYLTQLIDTFGITTAHFFPSALPSFLNSEGIVRCRSLRHVFCSGEQLPSQLAQRCHDHLPETRLYYLYVPTNGEFEAAHCECLAEGPSQATAIVRPIANTQVHILDPLMQPVPAGVLGEIYIGGIGVPGNHPNFATEKLVRSPVDPAHPNARLYKTGDLGRWRSDNAVEFLGRRHDLQMRLHGVSVDLNDIERFLTQIEGVREAAVVVCENAASEPKLLAYFTKSAAPDSFSGQTAALIDEMRAAACRSLPGFWQPASYLPIATLPLAANGKVDRVSLTARGWPRTETALDFAPLGSTEIALYAIWRDVLRIEHFGRFDNFFDLGGHSLLATQLASRVSRILNVELALRTIFETPTLEGLAQRIDEAKGKQAAISPPESAGQAAKDGAAEVASVKQVVGRIVSQIGQSQPTLSFSQQRMWLIQSLDPQNSAYNLSGAVRLFGTLDAEAFSKALDEVRRRHENLRSTFYELDGEIGQRIEPWTPQKLVAADLRAFGDTALEEGLRIARADARAPIDLTCGPVFRALLFRIADEEHLLQLTVHHISGDQWSVGIVAREVATAYNSLRAGKQVVLEPITLRYQDYAIWQRQHQSIFEEQLSYWQKKLRGLPSLELPVDFVRPQVRRLNGATYLAPIDPSLLVKLDNLSKREGSTLFMTMLAAFALQLHRLSGQEDFAIGVPIANRTNSDLEALVGTFVNTLALRVDLSGQPNFLTLLKRIRATALDGYAHQDISFDKLVQDVAQTRDNSRAPLVQVMFNMLNAPFHGVTFDELEWEPVAIDRGGAQFELSLSVDPQISKQLTFEYNTDLFEHRTIERFTAQYIEILKSIVAAPTQPITSVPMLPAAEEQILRRWNATTTLDQNRPRFIAMFEEQAVRAPDAPAITFSGQEISYSALNARANAVARTLFRLGIRPDDGIAICMARSIDFVAVLLGIQKAGAYYVPLDPSFPKNRLAYMLADSNACALITDSVSKDQLVLPDGLLHLDSGSLMTESEVAGDDDAHGSSSRGVAYIIYTSGSTGRPKGVVVGHESLSNFLLSMARQPGLRDSDVMVAVTTISFDIAGLELYLPLSVGACIELAPRTTASDAAALSRLIAESRATIMQATPATWRMLIDSGWVGDGRLRALCGGEALSRDLANALLARVGELWNLYGPTETTIWSTAARIEPGQSPISIGHPIENTRVYIVDQDGRLAPIGVPGEILIAGTGVAMGYHGLPELTAERFLRDRFVERQGERVYRTGDLGKWSSDGGLYHLGRIDNQIKVRGFRIEVGEIEFVLRQHPAVAEAIVVARELSAADNRLVAYVVYKHEDATASELRNYLRNHLPDYMVPALVIAIDSVPMTPNAKVDRAALPNPFSARAPLDSEHVAPTSTLERLIAEIWGDLLRVRGISADDNFFELGGHSLLAVRMAGIFKQRTGRALDPRTLYFKTLRQIAEAGGHTS